MKTQTRYFVFGKTAFSKTGVMKPLKNAETRQEARTFKQWQNNPSSYGIYDRHSMTVIH